MSATTTDHHDQSSGTGFFSIDRRIWAMVCDFGRINAAVAYLVLAQGTGRTNRNTTWSATSLTTYTGMRWNRACEAINELLELRAIAQGPEHTAKRPRYILPSWGEISPEPAVPRYKKRQTERSDAYESDPKDDLIWLPNSLVTGTNRGEESPLKRLRMRGDIWTLRLFVDLYHAHNLRDDGGINHAIVRQNYDSRQVGQRGIWNSWAFRFHNSTLSWQTGPFASHIGRPKIGDDAAVWSSIHALQNQGLLTFIPHVWENETTDSEIIHPYGVPDYGEPVEIEIATAARQAAYVIGSATLFEQAATEGFHYLCPVRQTIPAPAMIGIARLRYRPHTRRTREWYGELKASATKWVAEYNAITVIPQNVSSRQRSG